MALTTMRAPIADDERIPHEIADHDARDAWAAALVASAKADGSPARCVARSDCFVVTSIGTDDTVLFDLDTYISEANTSTGLAIEPFDVETVTTKGKRRARPGAPGACAHAQDRVRQQAHEVVQGRQAALPVDGWLDGAG